MADYDFSTLNSTDLEELVCDLLNAKEGLSSLLKYRTFKEGKDQGIDFLYSTDDNFHEHIGQVKHYYRTGFKGLLSKLEKEEVEKVRKLNPNKYIFATSVDLSVGETKQINDTFQPYIRNLNDIYGKKDLNRLLEQHEDVLTNHYKLWFSDTTILTRILNSNLEFRSSYFVEDELKKRIRFYVKTPLFDYVRENLQTNNFIIITGEPGVGKTTLAEMLIYEYINDGYDLQYISDDIKEIERVLRNDNSKQIFYFDDFLGSNTAGINKAQGSESALISIIGRVKKMNNKKLIFTTRSIILNTIVHESEKFTRFSKTMNMQVVHLSEYSQNLKERLLKNHIEESEMSDVLKNVFTNQNVIKYIVTHQNFNPRSIEFITLKENVKSLQPDQYLKYIITNLKDPSEIWKKSYEHQINYLDRWVLNTLLTFDGKIEEGLLEKAFNKRLEIFASDDPSVPVHPFRRSIEKLDKGFIIRKNGTVDFINPSLKDFLINFVGTDRLEVARMLKSIQYVKQLSGLFLSMVIENKCEITDDFKDDIIRNYEYYLRPKHIDHDLIHIATIINDFVEESNENKDRTLVKIITEIRDWEALHKNYELFLMFKKFVEVTKFKDTVNRALTARTEDVVNELFSGEYDVERSVDLLENLKDIFDIEFSTFNTFRIESHLYDLFSDHIINEIENLKDYVIDLREVDEFRERMDDLNERVQYLGLNFNADMAAFNCNWEEISSMNDFRSRMEKDD